MAGMAGLRVVSRALRPLRPSFGICGSLLACPMAVQGRTFRAASSPFLPFSRALSSSAPGGAPAKVPVSLLSGFLGSGKTTLMQELLTNKGGLKVGVVVNDVASVNIDAKLIRERSSSGIQTKSGEGVEFVELENGCACCDASGELLTCIEQLMEIAHVGGYRYDRIIIEMSGVAEPRNVRAEFHEAMREGHPVFDLVELSTMITVVDSPHFFRLYSSKNDVADHEELLGRDETHAERFEAMKWVEVERKVVDLLVEQVECSDMIVLNKADRVDAAQMGTLKGIVSALNADADVFECQFGKVPLQEVFGRGACKSALSDDDEDIRSAVRAAKQGGGGGHGHAHAHEHAPAPEHGHSHAHDHGHGHEHAHVETAAEKYGISTFVYSRRKPFHPQRLLDLVALLPVKSATRASWIDHMPAENWQLDKLVEGRLNPSMEADLQTMHTVVRSKGFVWVSTQWQNALYWSHAGAHFEMAPLGMWWAATKKGLWPDGGLAESPEVRKVVEEFEGAGEFGDRRQEIVFIGVGMDRARIERLLDACLLTDEELASVAERARTAFPPDPVEVRGGEVLEKAEEEPRVTNLN